MQKNKFLSHRFVSFVLASNSLKPSLRLAILFDTRLLKYRHMFCPNKFKTRVPPYEYRLVMGEMLVFFVKVESYAKGIPPESIPEGSPKSERSQLRNQIKSIHYPINHDETTEQESHIRAFVVWFNKNWTGEGREGGEKERNIYFSTDFLTEKECTAYAWRHPVQDCAHI